jgi:hypothetical protein
MGQVEFEVCMFAVRDDPEHMTLEIARKQGDSYSYHEYASYILSLVQNRVAEVRGPPTFKTVMYRMAEVRRPTESLRWNFRAIMQKEKLYEILKCHRAATADALKSIFGMVENDRYDSQMLGMESLMLMSDPNKSGWSTALDVARSLLNPEDFVHEFLGTKILDAAFRGSEHCSDHPFHGRERQATSYFSIIVLSHMFRVAAHAKNIDLEAYLSYHPEVDVVGCLLREIGESGIDPHRGYYAVHCLLALVRSAPSVVGTAKTSVIDHALQVGRTRHLALETVVRELKMSIQEQ